MTNTKPRKPGLHYQLILVASAIPLIMFTLWQGVQHGGWRYVLQRMGLGYKTAGNRPIWLHAASVGEVIAAEPLVRALKERHPELPLVISTATPTGADTSKKRLGDVSQHAYLPIDWHGAVRRFLDTVQPRCALIMETEIWPNLYQQCGARNIPLIMINARLSSKTLNTPGWIRRLYRGALANVQAILARSENEAEAFRQLGADQHKIHPMGNIKFAAVAQMAVQATDLGTKRPYVLLASSHDDEEQRIAKLWLSKDRGDTLLVIAPRHPKRSDTIQKQLKALTPHIAVRSKGESVNSETLIYLADTLGELLGLIQGAELVIMGGSLVPVGGHNIIEPARLAKACIVGPYTYNITTELEEFLQQRAIIQVADDIEMNRQVEHLLANRPERQSLGERTKLFIDSKESVLAGYIAAIERWL